MFQIWLFSIAVKYYRIIFFYSLEIVRFDMMYVCQSTDKLYHYIMILDALFRKAQFYSRSLLLKSQNTRLFLPKRADPDFPLDSIYTPWTTIMTTYLHAYPFLHLSSTFLIPGKTALLDTSNVYPLCTSIFLAESAWRKGHNCAVWYMSDPTGFLQTSNNTAIFAGAILPLSTWQFNIFFSLLQPLTCVAPFSLSLNHCVSYGRINNELIRVKFPGSQPHIRTPTYICAHTPCLVHCIYYSRGTIHILTWNQLLGSIPLPPGFSMKDNAPSIHSLILLMNHLFFINNDLHIAKPTGQFSKLISLDWSEVFSPADHSHPLNGLSSFAILDTRLACFSF